LKELARENEVSVDLVTSGSGPHEIRESFSAKIHIDRVPIAKKERHYWTAPEILEWFIRASRRIDRRVREQRYDLCHCWGGWPSGLIGQRHRRRMPYAIALRGSDVPGYNPRLRILDPLFLRPVSRPVWRNAAVVTCVSEFLCELARRTEPNIPYQVIRNGVDCERFQPGPRAETLSFLFVGRLIGRKGVDDLLEAFRMMAGDVPEATLRIVGGGPDLIRLVSAARRLDGRVSFHGPAESAALPEIYRNASVFVMPSIEEAMSNATLEAMASGLPVITTRTGVSEVIDGNGIVVGKRSPAEIADAMRKYAGDRNLVEKHGRRSREIAQTTTWGAVARAYCAAYDRILGGTESES
jgi:glycosyltransferase involved in cell wall biosynthesis